MRSALRVVELSFLSGLIGVAIVQHGGAASKFACDLVGDTSVLGPSDPGVVTGKDIFHRDSSEYPFATFTIASRDPTDQHKICLHYEIENLGPELIKSFRWKDIQLPFTDVPHQPRVRWDKNKYSRYDALGTVTSKVVAFENSPATTKTLLPIEQIEQNKSSDYGELKEYKVIEQFPSVEKALAEAGMPLTAVLAVPRSATDIPPLVSRFQTGEAVLTASSEVRTIKSFLGTAIRIAVPPAAEAELFAPSVERRRTISPLIKADSIIDYIKRVQQRQHERTPLESGVFYSVVDVPTNQPDPAFFVVDYPVTVQTKQGSFCIILTGFSAFPINLDDRYCESR